MEVLSRTVLIERYCTVVEKNVVLEAMEETDRTRKNFCLNSPECIRRDGKCLNRRICSAERSLIQAAGL